MDTFEALVRLEMAGWKALPPEPDASGGQPDELARLARRAGGLQKGDTTYRFVGAGRPPESLGPDAPFRMTLSDGLHVVEHRGELWVLESDVPGVYRLLARSLGGWLQHLLEPGPPLPLADDEGPRRVDSEGVWIGEVVDAPAAAPVDDALPPSGADVDELFGEGSGRPRPRSALISTLLVVGLFLTVLGMACINAPGGILVLLAWMFVEKDVERLESGYLPEADRAEVERLRAVTHAGLLLVVALFFLQALLLCFGFYDLLLDRYYIPWWRDLVVAVLGEAPA